MLEHVPTRVNLPNKIPTKLVRYDYKLDEPIVRAKIVNSDIEYELPGHVVNVIQNLYQTINNCTERLERLEAERDKYLYDFCDESQKFKNLSQHTKNFINGLLVNYSRDKYLTKQDIINEINGWYKFTKEAFNF